MKRKTKKKNLTLKVFCKGFRSFFLWTSGILFVYIIVFMLFAGMEIKVNYNVKRAKEVLQRQQTMIERILSGLWFVHELKAFPFL